MIKLKDYNNYYIDNNGDIFNSKGIKLKIFKTSSCEYPKIRLWKNSKVREFMIHRIVAINLIENKLNKPQVNHIDGNKNNYNPNNLEWVTASENMKHTIENGLYKKYNNQTYKNKFGKEHNKSISIICNNIKYESISEAGLKLNIPISTIHYSIKYNRPTRKGMHFQLAKI